VLLAQAARIRRTVVILITYMERNLWKIKKVRRKREKY